MESAARTRNSDRKMVGMGELAVAAAPATLSAVLGSCIGVTLYHPRLRVGALAHVVLPQAHEPTSHPAKYADLAIPAMLAELAERGVPQAGLVAKMAGGACMFGNSNGAMQIGKSNAEALTRALAAANIHLAAQDVGGNRGRKIVFDLETGLVKVEIAGSPTNTL